MRGIRKVYGILSVPLTREKTDRKAWHKYAIAT